MDYIRQIEQTNKRQMTALRPPHRKEVLKAREDDIKGKVQNWMSRDSEPRLERIATELLEEYNDVNLVAALLQELVESNDEVDVQLTFEKPLSRGKGRQGKVDQNVVETINVVAANSIAEIVVQIKAASTIKRKMIDHQIETTKINEGSHIRRP